MKQSKAKLRVASKFNVNQLSEQPLLATNPQAALPLLSMIGKPQCPIDDLLGQPSRQFIDQFLGLSARTVPGPKHPGPPPAAIRCPAAHTAVAPVGLVALWAASARADGDGFVRQRIRQGPPRIE